MNFVIKSNRVPTGISILCVVLLAGCSKPSNVKQEDTLFEDSMARLKVIENSQREIADVLSVLIAETNTAKWPELVKEFDKTNRWNHGEQR